MAETYFQRQIRNGIREFSRHAPAGQRRIMCKGYGPERGLYEVAARRLHEKTIRVVEHGQRIVWLKLGPRHSRGRAEA